MCINPRRLTPERYMRMLGDASIKMTCRSYITGHPSTAPRLVSALHIQQDRAYSYNSLTGHSHDERVTVFEKDHGFVLWLGSETAKPASQPHTQLPSNRTSYGVPPVWTSPSPSHTVLNAVQYSTTVHYTYCTRGSINDVSAPPREDSLKSPV